MPTPSERRTTPAMLRSAGGRCPNCGKGRLFGGYLKVLDECETCGEELHHHRADDAPPYFTIFIVGHILVPLVLWVEKAWQPAIATHMMIWLPLAVIMSLALLPVVKGALVGLQWALRMHGFELASSNRKQKADESDVTGEDLSEGWTT